MCKSIDTEKTATTDGLVSVPAILEIWPNINKRAGRSVQRNVFVKPNDQRKLAYFGMARKRGMKSNVFLKEVSFVSEFLCTFVAVFIKKENHARDLLPQMGYSRLRP